MYALHINRYVVHVVSRIRIVDLDRGGCCGPGDLLPRLTWRNARGKTRTLKYVTEEERLERSVSLQGFDRLTAGSAAELHGLVSGTLA